VFKVPVELTLRFFIKLGDAQKLDVFRIIKNVIGGNDINLVYLHGKFGEDWCMHGDFYDFFISLACCRPAVLPKRFEL